MQGKNLMVDGIPFAIAPRRTALDKILVEQAVAAGVELRDRFVVEDFLQDGERVTGIRGRDLRTGQRFEEQAQIVVGADGRHSRLAQAVQAPVYDALPPVTCYYFSYWRDVPLAHLELHVGRDFVIFAFPTNDNLLAVFISWPVARFPEIRADIETHFMATLDQVPELAVQVRAGQRTERFYGTADLPNFFRKPYGPGWALVGDAGHHKDPFLALGVADALRDAELVAQAVHDGLAGVRPLEAALAEFELRRNETSVPLYWENLEKAKFAPPPPELRQIQQALLANGDQEDINHFFKINLGLLPPESFFNPENVDRILKNAAMQESVEESDVAQIV
jgi:flavin-dependent dehydrogenase